MHKKLKKLHKQNNIQWWQKLFVQFYFGHNSATDRSFEKEIANNGGVCIDNRKDGTYLCQMKALIAKLTRLKY